MDLDTQWLAGQLPTPEKLDEMLGDDPAAALLGIARSRAPVVIEIGRPSVPPVNPEIARQLDMAVETVKKLQQRKSAKLTAEEVQALHAFVHLVTRPSLPVRSGALPGEIPTWPEIAGSASVIRGRLPGVGRLDTFSRSPQGTGWVVAEGLVITNNHVLAALCGLSVHTDPAWRTKLDTVWPKHDALWKKQTTTRPVWDPTDNPDATAPARVTGVRVVHPKVDLALLEADGVAQETNRVLRIAKAAPANLPAARTYTVGYPAVTHHGLHAALATLLFGPVAKVTKRVAPGMVGPVGGLDLRHDATTLVGSSGSAVISFDLPHEVVGLHFRGRYGEANYAVPLWLLAADPLLADNVKE